jgi:glycosyltransferase involved in cell wall biosynthesis
MKKLNRLIAFMNAYSQGKSGGDMVFIEIAKRSKEYDKIIVTSLLGKKLCQESGLRGKYLITTRELEFRNVIWTYLGRTIKALFLKLKPKDKDILLGTSDFLPDVLPLFWLKLRNKKNKWIQHIFHLIPSSRKIPSLAQKVSLFLIRHLADLVVVDNSLLKKDLTELGFESQKIIVNYPGIDHAFLKSIKTKKEKIYDGVFMAQLRPSKGIFDLIKIWKLVCKKLPEAKLGIIGKGEKEIMEKIKADVENASLKKNIDLLGFLEDDKAFAKIKASKVFVFPSHEEGFGIAPFEAQALGLPVVAWNLPVFDEIFKGGMVKVEIGDIERFADKVIKLLIDRGTYRQLSKEAIINATQYDWHQVARRELAILKRISILNKDIS